MPLVTTKEMFKKAYEGGYAIGAFNVNNMEIVQGITRACKKLNAPVILQCSSGARKYASHDYLVAMVKAAAEETGIDIALHLDHGPDFETCKSCIDGGFTSVMIDGSSLPYEENVALTKKVVDYAHAHGVVVEGELGTLAGVEDDVSVEAENASYTKPEQVEDFVNRTGVDSLAIAIGTSLPELVTTITAIVKKQSDLSIGNIIGANIIDLTMLLPICAFLSGGVLPVGKQSAFLDMPVCLLVICIAIIPTLIFKKLSRWQGALMVCIYIGYIAVLVTNSQFGYLPF